MSNVIRLGDYITEISEKTTVNNQHMVLTSSQEGIVSQDDYFNKQVASKDNTGYKIIRRGQFTYRAMSDTGRFYINRLTDYDIGIVSPAYPVFELRTNGQILPEYLQEYFHSEHFQNAITLSSTGSTRVSLKLAKIADLRIDIPTLPKQQCAVQAISHVNHLISMQNSSAAKLDQLVKSRFVEMFGHQSHNEKSLPYLTIDDVAEIYLGITHTPTYVDSGVMFISAKNTSGDFLDLSDVKYISREEFEGAPKGSKPQVNDVLFSRVGSNLGHPVILEEDLELCTFVSLGFLRTKGKVTSNYLKHWMRDEFFATQVSAHVKGGGQPNLNTGWLKEFKIIVPSIEAQKEFDEFCKQVDKSKLAVKQSLEKLVTLKKSLMQQYFG